MPIPSSQLATDRDRQFDDWGETITFRHFTETVDPETQEVTETQVDTALTAIPGLASSFPPKKTATRQLSDEIDFLIKAEDLPTTGPAPSSRIVYDGDEYDVLSFTLSAGGLVYALGCRKRV